MLDGEMNGSLDVHKSLMMCGISEALDGGPYVICNFILMARKCCNIVTVKHSFQYYYEVYLLVRAGGRSAMPHQFTK